MFQSNQMGVYIHYPFCASKCPYCDFNSHVRGEFDQKIWADAYVRELEHYAALLPDKQVVSIFFGGGTPSLMLAETVSVIIDAVQRLWSISNDIEITLEANPTSVEMDKFKAFRTAGVNRISLGVQALNDADLKFLGRDHSAEDALKAVEIAAQVFDRYSFDLIYGRPNQTLDSWGRELEEAIKYARGHMSLYQLTIERNTPFYMRHSRGEFTIPNDVKGADFYHLTGDIMDKAGLPAYEVSNHAFDGYECRHNLIYWHMADYIGVGAGAHGRFINGENKYASRDHSAPDIWLERVQKNGHGSHDLELLSAEDRLIESLMMGLRMRGGVSIKQSYDILDHNKLATVCAQGWAKHEGDNLRLTREGMLRLNAIIPYLLR